jgi:hypothetical protein
MQTGTRNRSRAPSCNSHRKRPLPAKVPVGGTKAGAARFSAQSGRNSLFLKGVTARVTQIPVRRVAVEKAGATQSMTKPISEARAARASRKSASTVDLLGSNSEIARKLKQYHDELLSLEVPDRFAELLGKLEQAERARKPGETVDDEADR